MLLGHAGPCGREERLRRLLQLGGQRTGAADLAPLADHAIGEGRGGLDDVAFHDLVDHAQLQRLLGRQRVAADDDVQRALHADQPRQPLRAAGARQQAQLHLRQSELRPGTAQR